MGYFVLKANLGRLIPKTETSRPRLKVEIDYYGLKAYTSLLELRPRLANPD